MSRLIEESQAEERLKKKSEQPHWLGRMDTNMATKHVMVSFGNECLTCGLPLIKVRDHSRKKRHPVVVAKQGRHDDNDGRDDGGQLHSNEQVDPPIQQEKE